MGGVWKIATIVGIPVQLHWSFSFLLFWVYYEGSRNNLAIENIMTFSLLLLALFLCVALHEFGHALAARRFGVGTKDITLSPLGGAARLERLPKKPMQEFIVALAGPLVNLCIAVFLGLGLWVLPFSVFPDMSDANPVAMFSKSANFFPLLFLLNLTLALFNLLPVFPMDGGRMLRSLLSMKLGRLKATRIASFIGRVSAIPLLLFAIYNGDFLFGFLSIFFFIMAAQEYYMVRIENVLNDKTVVDIYRKEYTPLNFLSPIEVAIDELAKGKEKNFLVFNALGELCGTLGGEEINLAAEQNKRSTPLKHFLKKSYSAALIDDKINTIYERMSNPASQILPVYDGEELVGLVEFETMDAYLRQQVKRRFAI